MDGRIVYCHGLPGSPAELGAFASADWDRHVLPLRRLARGGDDFEADLLAAFDALELKEPRVVMGFSLGAMATSGSWQVSS